MTANSEHASLRLGLFLAAFSALGYSLKAIFIKLAYPYGVDAVTLLTLRMGISLPLFLGIWLLSRGEAPPLTWGDRGRLLVMGLLGFYGASIFDFLGLQYITAGLERLILFTYPTLTVLIGVFFQGKAFTARKGWSMALCYGGIALAFLHDLRFGQADAVVLGSALVFISSVCYAGYLSGSEGLIRRLGATRFTTLAMLVSSAGIFLHFALTHSLVSLEQPLPVYGWSIAMAVFSTVAPVYALSEAIRRIGAGRTAMTSMLGPLLTIFFGWWLLGEAISLEQMIGAVLVVAGIVVVSRR
ncbi:MAG: DMT family transporter [Betaproteobacteria bacterium]